jgi:hypothetical protein
MFMSTFALLIVGTPLGPGMCVVLIAQNWCQAPICFPLLPDIILPLRAYPLLVHPSEARIRFLGLPGEQR